MFAGEPKYCSFLGLAHYTKICAVQLVQREARLLPMSSQPRSKAFQSARFRLRQRAKQNVRCPITNENRRAAQHDVTKERHWL